MKKIHCLIVDDEPLARQVLERYIAQTDDLILAASLANPTEAVEMLQKQTIDLLFLDIKMPELSGFQVLQQLTAPPKVILTTAYSEYALKAFDFGVSDYLMKPIAYERFSQAIARITRTDAAIAADADAQNIVLEMETAFLFFKTGNTFERVFLKNITYFEALGNFTRLYQGEAMLLISESLASLQQKLPAPYFIRVHKSFLINTLNIDTVTHQNLHFNTTIVPLGDTYKQDFFEKWKNI